MPRFKHFQKKQNSVQSVSQPVAESGPSFLQSTPCLPTHPTMSVRATTHLAPSFQPTSQATPTPQPVSQPSQSVHSISHPAPMDQAVPQPASEVHPASQPSRSVHSTSNLASTDQDSPQPALSVHSTSHLASTDQDSPQPAPTVQAASKKRSRSHWIVDAIDSEENIRKLRVKVNEVINLTCEERIVVDFDYLDEPFGDGRGLLSRFCGILACDCSLFPINFEKWLSLPISYFNRVFDQIIKPKFFFRTTESVAMGHIYKSIGNKWDANKNNLWRTHEDLLKSKTEIIESVSDGIPRDQWISFVDYQYKDSTTAMRLRNAENRKKQTIPHTGGSKANATRRDEMMAQTGQRPGRAQIYLATHKNQDGVYVNEAAKEICEKIELALSQSTIDESQISRNDVVGKVLGEEHSGRVRCLGLGPIPSKVFKQARPHFSGISASISEASCSSQCQQNHKQMMNAFKEYMIMKEGTIPEQFAGFFASSSAVSPTTAAK